MEKENGQEVVDDLTVAVAALAYYVYKGAGCPYGDNLQGLHIWIGIQITVFSQIDTGETNDN